jgi:hypothetical protein
MLVFVTSDKGGTGRSVTSSNIAYRSALLGRPASYVDFDFGSPTAGAIFDIPHTWTGVGENGMEHYLRGKVSSPARIDVWASSHRPSLRERPPEAAALTLFPGSEGGTEFAVDQTIYNHCAVLFQQLEEQFEVSFIDLSAGRSFATDIVLAVTAMPGLRHIPVRWLVFHRWTRQHVRAAAALVHDKGGILDTAVAYGHTRDDVEGSLRFVRTAVIDPGSSEQVGLRPSQAAFLAECQVDLTEMSSQLNVGRSRVLGQVPLEPLLQWREQLISDNDVYRSKIANKETVAAFAHLAEALFDDENWGMV